jgi:hypothetical protein
MFISAGLIVKVLFFRFNVEFWFFNKPAVLILIYKLQQSW